VVLTLAQLGACSGIILNMGCADSKPLVFGRNAGPRVRVWLGIEPGLARPKSRGCTSGICGTRTPKGYNEPCRSGSVQIRNSPSASFSFSFCFQHASGLPYVTSFSLCFEDTGNNFGAPVFYMRGRSYSPQHYSPHPPFRPT
jgi:hypothetical protein